MLFKDILKELREERNLTQKQVATACSVTPTCICQLESGVRSPTGSTLVSIADFFGISIDYLMGRESADESLAYLPLDKGDQLSQEEKEILRLYRSINREFQHMAIGYLRKLGELEASQKIFQSPSRKESK